MTTVAAAPSAGELIRRWRSRRGLSQLALALDVEMSTRHLSFVETGRATPSRDLIMRLAERLEMPLRERNVVLVAAGHAPVFPERRLEDPALAAARRAVELVLAAHEPFPALAVDRYWTMVAANRAVAPLLDGVDPSLLAPSVNVLRLSLHPAGLAPRIENLADWRHHLLDRLRRQVDASGDATLAGLLDELRGYPAPRNAAPPEDFGGVAVPLRIATRRGTLAFFSTTAVFGTPVDVTLSELALEAFLPADAATADALRALSSPAAEREASGGADRPARPR